ncbi:TetR/AcrR family transcriptional regulator [Couchioplanes caeruleus]|uniref:TetR/AcrR family transcriptional regulator n=1 Tax=Couchioplanes caeruleus TaxID=56438 RepID=UPI0020BE065B|nr:TetR/AcrR family transcriptional regulator C-terminal domain-containing protein [Couchioplanes caeruleus]UQU66173.1 TetR/AcrR family transcriptional regulator [Couchioplanes caeruleus]
MTENDPDRVLALLWRHRNPPPGARTGRRPRLSVDEVVAAGVSIADTEGLEAASMAKVAARLGVGTMTLYTYVPSRTELLELMVDHVLVSRDLPGPGDAGPADWQDRIHLYAQRTLDMYRAHPWLSRISTVRPPLGPGTFREREFVLSAVAGTGLPIGRVNEAALAVTMLVTSAARQEGENVLLRRASGQSNDSWWAERSGFWESWFDEDQHPTMTRVWHADGFGGGTEAQAAAAFTYGLRLLLDGIAREAGS